MTTLKLVSNVVKIIKANVPYKDHIAGDVYIGSRPMNSAVNDIVVGSLSLPDEIVSKGTVLVNIFAKDLKGNQTSEPDFKKLNTLAELITPLFRDKYYPEYRTEFSIEWTRDYKVENVQEWVYVIRIKANILKEN